MGLKIGDLDLDLYGKICLEMQQLLKHGNFTLKLELCIDDLKDLNYSKTCDLDLDIQGQIGLQSWKIFFKTFY